MRRSGDGILPWLLSPNILFFPSFFIRVNSCPFVANILKKGGTGIRTQDNGFANRGLSPLGDAAALSKNLWYHQGKGKARSIFISSYLPKFHANFTLMQSKDTKLLINGTKKGHVFACPFQLIITSINLFKMKRISVVKVAKRTGTFITYYRMVFIQSYTFSKFWHCS